MKKLINVKKFCFYIDEELKHEVDKYLQNMPYGFSAFVRLLVEKETTKYMPNAGLDKKEYKRVNDRLNTSKKYILVSANIEEIDLKVLDYLSDLQNISKGTYIRNLIENKMYELR